MKRKLKKDKKGKDRKQKLGRKASRKRKYNNIYEERKKKGRGS